MDQHGRRANHPLQIPLETMPAGLPQASNTSFDSNSVSNQASASDSHSRAFDGPQATPSSGVHRSRPSVTIGRHDPTADTSRLKSDKRKRSRVTPEQLVELEKVFSVNRTPTAAQRKVISDKLGMIERQTQIWFQNRRAKAKHQEQRPPSPAREHSSAEPGSELAAALAAFDEDVPHLIRERDPVSLITCSDLKIGAWRRINSTLLHHDLLAYTCEARQSIAWFIRSAGLLFKIEVLYQNVKSARLITDKNPGLMTLILGLHAAPVFYIQQPDVRLRPGESIDDVRKRIGISRELPFPSLGAQVGDWVVCNDFTAHRQATSILQHELTGPAPGIIMGAKALPQELGLFPEGAELHPTYPNQELPPGIDAAYLDTFLNGLAEREGSHPPSVHTPSSQAGTGSQYAHTPTSSIYTSASGSAYTPGSTGYEPLPDVSSFGADASAYANQSAYLMPDGNQTHSGLQLDVETGHPGPFGIPIPTPLSQHGSKHSSVASSLNSSRSSLASVGVNEFMFSTSGLLEPYDDPNRVYAAAQPGHASHPSIENQHLYDYNQGATVAGYPTQNFSQPAYPAMPDRRSFSEPGLQHGMHQAPSQSVPPQSTDYSHSLNQPFAFEQPPLNIPPGHGLDPSATYGNTAAADLFQGSNPSSLDDSHLFGQQGINNGAVYGNSFASTSGSLQHPDFFGTGEPFMQAQPQAATSSTIPDYLQYSQPSGH